MEFDRTRYISPPDSTAWVGRNTLQRAYPGSKPSQIRDQLSSVDAYTRHREPKPVKHNPLYVRNLRELLQSDLTDLSSLAPWNDGYKHWLVVQDTFSRKVWLTPLKDKLAQTVSDAFEVILADVSKKGAVARLLTDRGPEYQSNVFQAMLRRHAIRWDYPIYHAPHVERVQKTLQQNLSKHMTQNETRTYINFLDDIVRSYNRRFHSMIRMSPNQAERERNHLKVRLAMEEYYHKAELRQKKPTLKVGEYVRVRVQETAFQRSYDETFSVKLYVIHKVLTNMPRPMYMLKDGNDVVMDDKYYEEELQPVSGVFKIKHVLPGGRTFRGRRQRQVEWMGWPKLTWVNEADLEEPGG